MIAFLKTLAAELRRRADEAEDYPEQAYHFAVIARQVEERIHMLEEGLVG